MNGSSLSAIYDVLLVGGGLQSALIALAVLDARPAARVAIIEQNPRLAGNHTWSFHGGDVPETARTIVEPLVTYSWQGYDVAFPGFERTIPSKYAAISSHRLASIVEARIAGAPGSALFTGVSAKGVDATSVTLSDGRTLSGHLVVDARGPQRFAAPRTGGYQKFLGLELLLTKPHERPRATLMDACVRQTDGYRFFYVLPLDARRLLVEDTYFSNTPQLDAPALREGVLAYVAGKGCKIADIVREEQGVLPLPARGSLSEMTGSPMVAGYAGGWFHPATGYSFPVALRLALHIARGTHADLFGERWERLVARHRSQFRFACLLNRMLFGAFQPERRFTALERFYRLPEETIHRFYALAMTRGDRLRLLCGRPPRGLSLRAAIGASP
jgi:lycopene beta-cyclase